MASTAEQIIDRIVTDLAVAGTHYTLTSRVVVGPPLEGPPSTPWVALGVASLTTRTDPESASLGRWRASLRVELEGWVDGVTATPDGRARAALRLLSDITAALGSDRLLGGTYGVVDVVPELTALDGDAHGVAVGYGYVAGVLVIDYITAGRT